MAEGKNNSSTSPFPGFPRLVFESKWYTEDFLFPSVLTSFFLITSISSTDGICHFSQESKSDPLSKHADSQHTIKNATDTGTLSVIQNHFVINNDHFNKCMLYNFNQ